MPVSTAPRFLVARRQKWLPVADRAHVSRLGMAGVVRPMGSSKHDQPKRRAEASVSASLRRARIRTPACSVTGSPSAPADRSWCSTGTRTRSSISMQATGMRATVRPGPHSIAWRARLQARLAFGTRPISSSEPSRSTPACRFRGWPRRHPPCRWRGVARQRWSGSACDKPPETRTRPGAGRARTRVPAQRHHAGEKWSDRRFPQR
jgi:hypothetical protein